MKLLTLMLCLCAAGAAGAAPPPDLAFKSGTLAGWEKQGNAFYATPVRGKGPSLEGGVCSSDRGKAGRTGLLRRQFVIPQGVSHIRFRAYAVCAGADTDWPGDERLDVLLAAAGKRVLPKQVLTARGWQLAPLLLPRQSGQARDYCWEVSADVGRTVQIIIGDQDERPGCYIFCSGFRFVYAGEQEARAFSKFMVRLSDEHQMAPPIRYDSRHFTALSNTDGKFTRMRLNNCELIYHLFFNHFRRKRITVQTPPTKLMVAIFDSQDGFEAYLGRKMGPNIVGIYHPVTNRLVVYDLARNEAFVAGKRSALERGRALGGRINQRRYVDTVQRLAREYRTGANVGIIMHEVAHQLSFNAGMLNRKGDVPAWLAEGLACYCEATDNGAWLGIGELNPQRLNTLRGPFTGKGQLFHLQSLVASDDWLRRNTSSASVLIGYAQSWGLFHMLMQEQPRALAKYLTLIYQRRGPDHRLTDFRQVFGSDLNRLELHYINYLKKLVQEHRDLPR